MLEYPWTPHETVAFEYAGTAATREQLVKDVKNYVATLTNQSKDYQIDDLIHMVIQNGLRHVPETEIVTLALANARIPDVARTTYDTLRYLIAYQYEKDLGVKRIIAERIANIVYQPRYSEYAVSLSDTGAEIRRSHKIWSQNASGIVEIMKVWESITSFASLLTESNVEIVRAAGRVKAGNLVGAKFETTGNPFLWRIRDNPILTATTPINTEVITRNAARIQIENPDSLVNQTDGIKVTALNGAVKITWRGTTGETILTKDSEQTIPLSEFQSKIILQLDMIDAPKVIGSIANITNFNVGVTESVSLTNLFEGERLTITASSSDTTKATVQVNQTQTSMGVIAKGVGPASITVTATNETGAAKIVFHVAVIPVSSG